MLRFWSKVAVKGPSDCWEWLASKTSCGYGQFGLNKRVYGAHRALWTLLHGELDSHMFVCHTCDNKSCVNPNHLFIGTHKDNMYDMKTKGRAVGHNKSKTHCKRGHAFDIANTMLLKDGRRQCRVCRRMAYHKRKKV